MASGSPIQSAKCVVHTHYPHCDPLILSYIVVVGVVDVSGSSGGGGGGKDLWVL